MYTHTRTDRKNDRLTVFVFRFNGERSTGFVFGCTREQYHTITCA